MIDCQSKDSAERIDKSPTEQVLHDGFVEASEETVTLTPQPRTWGEEGMITTARYCEISRETGMGVWNTGNNGSSEKSCHLSTRNASCLPWQTDKIWRILAPQHAKTKSVWYSICSMFKVESFLLYLPWETLPKNRALRFHYYARAGWLTFRKQGSASALFKLIHLEQGPAAQSFLSLPKLFPKYPTES